MIKSRPSLAVAPHVEVQHGTLVQMARHLAVLFPSNEWLPGEGIEARCLDCSTAPARPGPRRFFTNHAELLAIAGAWRDSWDVFVGVGFRRCPITKDIATCTCETRGLEHVSRLSVAWCDLDAGPRKPYRDVAEIVDVLRQLPVAPELIVSSGSGAHPYWALPAPTSNIERVVRLNRSLKERLNGDNAIDGGRILRLAGTFNRKGGGAAPVTLLSWPTGGAHADD